MSTEQVIDRMVTAESKHNMDNLISGKPSDEDVNIYRETIAKLSEKQILIDDRSALSALEMRMTARQWKRKYDIDLLIMDYLQLAQPHESKESNNENVWLTEVSRTLKQIARENKIPVLALSQLSRNIEKRGKENEPAKPMLADLRGSGSIEQDADVVMFLQKDSSAYAGEGIETDRETDMESIVPMVVYIEKKQKRTDRNGEF